MRFLLVLGLLLILALPPPVEAALVPAGFIDEAVTRASFPTALEALPDGRLLIAQQTGELLAFTPNTAAPVLLLNLAPVVCSNLERGLLGIAADPAFPTNGFIYLYYTLKRGTSCPAGNTASPDHPVNRVARFTLAGSQVVAGSETVLIDNIPSLSGRHNAGDLHIAADGYLYVSVGESGTGGGLAQNRNSLGGKILRVDRTTGAGVAGNLYFGAPDARRCGSTTPGAASGACEETFATGLRNPIRMAFKPGTSDFYINDVGQRTWEEINVGQAGANYGWPGREGPCPANQRCTPRQLTVPPDPIFYYRHGGNPLPSPFQECNSVTGGAFVPQGAWGAAYDGMYLFADYVCGTVFLLRPQPAGGVAAEVFASTLGGSSVVDLEFGADGGGGQALYYTNYATGLIGRVRSTRTVGTPPTNIEAEASPRFAASAPLIVSFEGSASVEPAGGALSYRWNFGDGTTGSGSQATHTYTQTGIYSASLTATDARGLSTTSNLLPIHVGNTPPTPKIEAPTAADRYFVGQTITLRGSANDSEDGALGAQNLIWQVTLHHDSHTHPYLPPTSGDGITITTPAPEDLAAVTTSYLRVDLRARDSWGLDLRTSTVLLRPRIVTITLESEPAGMALQVADAIIATPAQVASWPGYVIPLAGLAQSDAQGRQVMLTRWGDGTQGVRLLSTPGNDSQLLAIFEPARTLFLPLGGR